MALGRRKNAKVELLRGVPLFAACSERELRRIASLADEIDVRQGKVLMNRGDPGRECFVVVDGHARATMPGKRAARIGPGDCVGEMSLLDQGPRSASVTAQTDMKLLVLGSRGFSALIGEVPSVARKVMRALAERLREADRQPTH